MSKLIILRGNSGSGKTTIAKALQWKRPFKGNSRANINYGYEPRRYSK